MDRVTRCGVGGLECVLASTSFCRDPMRGWRKWVLDQGMDVEKQRFSRTHRKELLLFPPVECAQEILYSYLGSDPKRYIRRGRERRKCRTAHARWPSWARLTPSPAEEGRGTRAPHMTPMLWARPSSSTCMPLPGGRPASVPRWGRVAVARARSPPPSLRASSGPEGAVEFGWGTTARQQLLPRWAGSHSRLARPTSMVRAGLL
jgi:hypothetical protein